ncbi:MAG: BMP family ABC transporter substrate-binding protein [Propionibacteriales bacterium]|nr:BMP family ABC transporter substrate-binding protein [Propionibacteriales bacterium]
MKTTARVVALASVLALSVAACGDRPKENTSSGAGSTSPTETTQEAEPAASNPDFKACMVSDSGGFDDKSFNQTSHDGLVNAVKNLGTKQGEVESQSDSEYADNISALLRQKCNAIVTVGFLLGEATEKAAKANKDVDFAIVDFGYAKPPPNLKGLSFDTAQPAFMAGYLAAGMTQTGVVGTFGGLNIPTVTIFMDGYWEGVQYWNEQNDDDVQVVGWDEESQEGSFTDDFEDKIKGQTTAENMISQGADIILPVAGPAGLGALEAAQSSDGKVNAIWVDTDGCVSAAEYCDVIISSVMKGMDVAVEKAIKDSVDDKFSNEPFVGTLENGGVQLAPFNEFEDEVPQELKDQLEQIKSDLMDGTIKITSPSAPQ